MADETRWKRIQQVARDFPDGDVAFLLAHVPPEQIPAPAVPELHRIIWWQSLVEGMNGGETLESDVRREDVEARVFYWRASLAGAIGVMIGATPMSFVPAGDIREQEERDALDSEE